MEVDVEAFSDPSFNSESPTSPRRLCCQFYWRNSLSSSFYTVPVPVSRQMQHGGVVQENGGIDQQHQQPEVQVSALPPREPSQVPPEMQDSKHQEQLSIGSETESTRPFSCDNHHTYYQHQHQPPLQIPPASEPVFRYASLTHPAPAPSCSLVARAEPGSGDATNQAIRSICPCIRARFRIRPFSSNTTTKSSTSTTYSSSLCTSTSHRRASSSPRRSRPSSHCSA
ncbi:hypothetical protein GALMADRAFT_1256208 [Galerina marginata CBS 339.88]|uniref:Uncharacterized protein n=1 Tax=Galerina marginata (strain CBS 339.88) TaxID=685588 RepID=A0A067T5V7_GALM3|nr:hypothetical protein GALMADRAFT_1256208 [Galerina marginata CBS 339.88]